MSKSKFLLTGFLVSMFAMQVHAQANKTVVQTKTVSTKNNSIDVMPKKTEEGMTTSVAGSTRIKIVTDSGTMIVRLYDSTPLHRDNFVKLVQQGFYDSLLFHRVIQGFMIQGGDPLSKNAAPGVPLGMGGGDMARIPAEFRKSIIHKKGALAAARDGNPEKASSACQFYIVQGRVASDDELNSIEGSISMKYSAEQRNIYKTIGGTPMLDQNYTVFGEVESGMEVIDKIASVPKAPGDRPVGDVHMHMELIK